MVLFNYSAKELTAKVVYYGPGLCGKTTNLQVIYNALPQSVKGKMLSLSTKTDRTLFFDFLPLDLGNIAGMKTRIQLYTVPGQVFYNETRRLVLKGSDGIVFVADSQAHLLNANIESFKNLEENLKTHGMSLKDMPLVLQFNKRDLPSLSSIEEMNLAINKYNAPFYESVATTGIGVQDTLRAITKLVLIHLSQKFDLKLPDKMKEKKEVEKEEVAQDEKIPQAVGVAQQQEQVSSSIESQPEISMSVEPELSSEASSLEEDPVAAQEVPIPVDTPEEQKTEEEELLTETSGWLPPEDQTEDQIPSMPDENIPVDTFQSVEVPPAEKSSQQDSVEDSIKEEASDGIEEEMTVEDIPMGDSETDEFASPPLSEELPSEEIKMEVSEPVDEQIKDETHGVAEESVEFEIKEEPPSPTPETEKEADIISISPGGMQEIRIPFVLETGEGKRQFHLKISLKLEENER